MRNLQECAEHAELNRGRHGGCLAFVYANVAMLVVGDDYLMTSCNSVVTATSYLSVVNYSKAS